MKQGVVTIHNPYQKYKSMRVVMFLLSDIILFGKPKSEEFLEECNRRKNCFTLHTKVPLHQTRLIDIFAEDWANSFELQHIQKSKSKARCFLISAESAEDKKDWILKLKELIRKYQLQRIESDRAIDVGRKEKNRIRWSRKEKKEKREKKLKKSGGEKEKGGSPKEIDDEYIQSVMRVSRFPFLSFSIPPFSFSFSFSFPFLFHFPLFVFFISFSFSFLFLKIFV